MLHQIREPVGGGDVGRARGQQMMLHRAMRTHCPPRGRGTPRREVHKALGPRHKTAQREPQCQPPRLAMAPAARGGDRGDRRPAIARRARARAGGLLRFPGGAQEMLGVGREPPAQQRHRPREQPALGRHQQGEGEEAGRDEHDRSPRRDLWPLRRDPGPGGARNPACGRADGQHPRQAMGDEPRGRRWQHQQRHDQDQPDRLQPADADQHDQAQQQQIRAVCPEPLHAREIGIEGDRAQPLESDQHHGEADCRHGRRDLRILRPHRRRLAQDEFRQARLGRARLGLQPGQQRDARRVEGRQHDGDRRILADAPRARERLHRQHAEQPRHRRARQQRRQRPGIGTECGDDQRRDRHPRQRRVPHRIGNQRPAAQQREGPDRARRNAEQRAARQHDGGVVGEDHAPSAPAAMRDSSSSARRAP